jgi:hypothetical protein
MWIVAIVMVVGLLVHLLVNKPDPPATRFAEAGRIMFWTGLLVILFRLASQPLPHLFG